MSATKETAEEPAKEPSAAAPDVPAGAGRAAARLARVVEKAIGELDLSLSQYRVLALLGDGSTAASVLARQLAVSPPSVTAVIDGLVGRGLVERRPDPQDRRRLTLLLTADGARTLRRADDAAEEGLGALSGFLDDSRERARALRAFEAWGRALDRSREALVKTEAGR